MQKLIFPKKLKEGSHIRVIAPSRSGAILPPDIISKATAKLEKEGFVISFGRHWTESDDTYMTASIEARLADLHEAFADPSVDGVLSAIGGYSSNQLLQHIDYKLIRENPKVFCGFSDVTTLSNAFLSQAGLVTYLGPHFSSWAMQEGFEYTAEMFRRSVMADAPFQVIASKTWSDDMWYVDQKDRIFTPNDTAEMVLQPGNAEGILIGGNIDSFANLLGTIYKPSMIGTILLIEQSDPVDLRVFDAMLQSIIQQPDFYGVQGILIGRFPKSSNTTKKDLLEIVRTKPELSRIPIVANINFGHTTPIATFAIGGKCGIYIDIHNSVSVRVDNH